MQLLDLHEEGLPSSDRPARAVRARVRRRRPDRLHVQHRGSRSTSSAATAASTRSTCRGRTPKRSTSTFAVSLASISPRSASTRSTAPTGSRPSPRRRGTRLRPSARHEGPGHRIRGHHRSPALRSGAALARGPRRSPCQMDSRDRGPLGRLLGLAWDYRAVCLRVFAGQLASLALGAGRARRQRARHRRRAPGGRSGAPPVRWPFGIAPPAGWPPARVLSRSSRARCCSRRCARASSTGRRSRPGG